jgi:hypothetical protein
MKTQKQIRNIIGRACANFRRENPSLRLGRQRVTFHDNRIFTVQTHVAGGDNAPWATRPMSEIWSRLDRAGVIVGPSRNVQHCKGDVAAEFVIKE